ncbi:MAG: DUF5131 family protein, partial [Planctomycetota bacterium]
TVEEVLDRPLRWKKPGRVFVNSMADLFHPEVPFDFIDRVFAVMALTPQHQYQVLTKRPERMAEYLRYAVEMDNFQHELDRLTLEVEGETFAYLQVADGGWPLSNVWLGTSVEDQAAADERIGHLLRCPAAVRFLSCEPLLGAVDLADWLPWGEHDEATKIDWVIAGGESGPGARPCDLAWLRSIVDQCAGARVPCFVKQLGARPVRANFQGRMVPVHGEDCWSCGHYDLMPCDGGGEICGRCGRANDRLRDKQGGDPGEWPEDLRVREWPETVVTA